jgi:hypothetical protein
MAAGRNACDTIDGAEAGKTRNERNEADKSPWGLGPNEYEGQQGEAQEDAEIAVPATDV